jgi:hypothetical protein
MRNIELLRGSLNTYMTGPDEGQWMHAHSTIGSAPNNMGNESYFRWTKAASNSKKQVSLNHFLGGFKSYASNVNQEEFAKISDMFPRGNLPKAGKVFRSVYRGRFEGTVQGDMKDMICLSEEFVLCEALESKWSDEVRHKCTCACFFRNAVCEHVVLLSMLADPSHKILPAKNDIRRIRQRASKKKGRPAADGDSDSLDEPRKKPKGKEPKEKTLMSWLLSDLDSPAEVRSIIP